ncbi:MAG: NAD-dependent epimerase/dehydratase family protein [Terriglobia bacterium]
MRILMIGGTGNISTGITQRLVRSGADLTLVKRSASAPEAMQGVRVIACDRTDHSDFQAKVAGEGRFDCVIDMVCYEPEDALSDVETLRGRAGQLIFCSTVDVYTKAPASYPVTEENGIIKALPSFPYAWKKVQCEEVMSEAHRRGDFPVTVIRPAFTYNDKRTPGIHSFGGQTYHLDRLLKGKPIILHGDGTSIWTATHRDDVSAAFVNAIGNARTYGQDYNVTGDEWMTHNHIWRTIAIALGAPAPDFVYIPTELLGKLAPTEAAWCVENFRYNNIFDNSKAKRDIGFRYTIPFRHGVAGCIEYLTHHGEIEDSANHPFYDRIVDTWRSHVAEMTKTAGAVEADRSC